MDVPTEKPFIRAPWNWMDTALILFFVSFFTALFLGVFQAGGD